MQNKISQNLEAKISQHQARIAVIGLGYVGLPLVNAFYQKGFAVSGLDNNPQKISRLKAGINDIPDVDAKQFAALAADQNTVFSTEPQILADADVVLICVPTPLSPSKEPDLSFILAAAHAIKTHLHQGQLIILESTTYPGTTDEVLLPILESAQMKLDQDFCRFFA